jgi:hypothetical protein
VCTTTPNLASFFLKGVVLYWGLLYGFQVKYGTLVKYEFQINTDFRIRIHKYYVGHILKLFTDYLEIQV